MSSWLILFCNRILRAEVVNVSFTAYHLCFGVPTLAVGKAFKELML